MRVCARVRHFKWLRLLWRPQLRLWRQMTREINSALMGPGAAPLDPSHVAIPAVGDGGPLAPGSCRDVQQTHIKAGGFSATI